mgnify:CR=1 FL=1
MKHEQTVLLSELQIKKELEKKVLLSMTGQELKAMCSKLFKIEVTKQSLWYH